MPAVASVTCSPLEDDRSEEVLVAAGLVAGDQGLIDDVGELVAALEGGEVLGVLLGRV